MVGWWGGGVVGWWGAGVVGVAAVVAVLVVVGVVLVLVVVVFWSSSSSSRHAPHKTAEDKCTTPVNMSCTPGDPPHTGPRAHP